MALRSSSYTDGARVCRGRFPGGARSLWRSCADRGRHLVSSSAIFRWRGTKILAAISMRPSSPRCADRAGAARRQPFATALMPKSMLPVASSTGSWLSAYLPGDAALRALGELTVGMEWTATSRSWRRFDPGRLPGSAGACRPDTPHTALAAVLLTADIRPVHRDGDDGRMRWSAHLAFNLIWPWWCSSRRPEGRCRRDHRRLHRDRPLRQLLFHPLFVAPFLAHLWLRGERRRADCLCPRLSGDRPVLGVLLADRAEQFGRCRRPGIWQRN